MTPFWVHWDHTRCMAIVDPEWRIASMDPEWSHFDPSFFRVCIPSFRESKSTQNGEGKSTQNEAIPNIYLCIKFYFSRVVPSSHQL